MNDTWHSTSIDWTRFHDNHCIHGGGEVDRREGQREICWESSTQNEKRWQGSCREPAGPTQQPFFGVESQLAFPFCPCVCISTISTCFIHKEGTHTEQWAFFISSSCLASIRSTSGWCDKTGLIKSNYCSATDRLQTISTPRNIKLPVHQETPKQSSLIGWEDEQSAGSCNSSS